MNDYPNNPRPPDGHQRLRFNITIIDARVACTLHPGQGQEFDTAEEAQAAAWNPREWCEVCQVTLDVEEDRPS